MLTRYADKQALEAGDSFPASRQVCLFCLRESVGLARQPQPQAAPDGDGSDVVHVLWGGCVTQRLADPFLCNGVMIRPCVLEVR